MTVCGECHEGGACEVLPENNGRLRWTKQSNEQSLTVASTLDDLY
jgi:hypothetical protein